MDRDLLHRALLEIERIGGGELICSDCVLCFELMSKLKAHILSHNSSQESVEPAAVPEVIMSHAKEKRGIVKPHHCFRCKQSFTEASHLSKHILHHVRQKENGKVKQKKVFKVTNPAAAQNPTSKTSLGRRRHIKVPEAAVLTSTPASNLKVQSTQKNYRNYPNKKDNNQARVSYIIRTRRSVIRTRLSSRLTINEQNQQHENRLQAEESVLAAESVVNSLPMSSTSMSHPSRVSDSCFIGSSQPNFSPKAFSQGIGDDNKMLMPPPVVWNLGRLSKNTEDKEPSVVSVEGINRRQNSTVAGSLLAPETMTGIGSSSSGHHQINPEPLLIDTEAQSLTITNRGLPSSNHTSGSDLTYASILMPTPPRKLGLRFPTKR
ncbi:unnamed protein product [Orchesella dallaii]|uniref:C2H2-type domain-containing protein n=1 Tax=Orchesella dallaii TaxID=48710 RepID=A0ABP1RBF4_9HEXA